MSVETVRALISMASTLLVDAGLPKRRAQQTAAILVQADVWEIPSHGLLRLPIYLDRLKAGGSRADAELGQRDDTGPFIVYDGGGGLGHWQLQEVASECANRAGEYGLAAAGLGNSGHCGALGVYAAQVAAQGKLGLLFSSGPPAIPPWGGHKPVLSTSPIAAGIPFNNEYAIVDLSLSTAARGRIVAHRNAGTKLPDGWAFDSQGNATTDPTEALNGMLAPLGGAKGYALAFMVEALTAGLFGPMLSIEMPDFFDSGAYEQPQYVSHFVLALDPDRLAYNQHSRGYWDRLSELCSQVENAGGRVPGRAKRLLEGHDDALLVEVDDVVHQDLTKRLAKIDGGG